MFSSIINYYKEYRKNKIITLFKDAMMAINLDMLERARGKKNYTRTKEFKDCIKEITDKHISLFTHKEWMVILGITKNEEVKSNLEEFLTTHYKEIYSMLNMKYYDIYQMKDKGEISTVLYIEDVYVSTKKTSAVIFYYKDLSRMCYSPLTGERLIIENIMVKNNSIFIVLVQYKEKFIVRCKNYLEELFMGE